jgi:hypothetical protein
MFSAKCKFAMVGVLFAALLAYQTGAPTTASSAAAPQVIGNTLGEWSAAWWQWAFSIPAATNPLLDPTGAFCALGQQGPVWYLGGVNNGGTAERSCAIPRGKSILFPIVNDVWIQTPTDDPNNTEADFRRLANENLPPSIGGDLEATLDGVPIVFNFMTPIVRSQSPVFTATFPFDNFFGLDPALLTGFPIVSDGFWVMLPPLAPGAHLLHFRAGQAQDITYHLTIGNP